MLASEEIAQNLLSKKFGKQNLERIYSLVTKLITADAFIEENKSYFFQNILLIEKKDIIKTLNFLYDLSETSYFAAAFFVEKIPTLYFYDLLDEYISLLSATRHYGARGVAYVIGSSELKNDDLADVLRAVDTRLYKKVLHLVIKRHESLNILSLHILRRVVTVTSAVQEKDLGQFFDICTEVQSQYGNDISIIFVDNISSILKYFSLKMLLKKFAKFNNVSKEYLQLVLNIPEIVKAGKYIKPLKKSPVALKLYILKSENYKAINTHPELLNDPYFLAILQSWSKYPKFHKQNILQQLEESDFKKTLLSNQKITRKIKNINNATGNNWFKAWCYAGKQVDNNFIYEEIKKILLPSSYFKHNTKKIYNEQRSLIERIKQSHETGDLVKLIEYLKKICLSKEISGYLDDLKNYLKRSQNTFIDRYSKSDLFIKTWDRNPWNDYARSDELYACTSIGKSADLYAPVYLADINNNNLDIYNNNLRIGRIRLFLLKDTVGDQLLLIDCIDGSDRLMRNHKRLTLLLDSIKTYGRFLKISKLFFNTDLMFNNTPKLFNSFLKVQFKDEKYFYVKRFVENGSQKDTMLYPVASFMESLKNRDEGVIKGFLITL
ncbi:hypothetical protein A2631_02100 [Candidatus Daviesbacteria bacterium RIFCSPHIGHO2_01_FULL_44_29]|uniref:Uncharacterized protein n=1 Tax=Candidatus Daviesbacteria bacterium RIFCSPHIGHO2_02_FULL_43_12 TaxID=1797776 RepID=A0A1F5KK33_9BACT|nr:MAG: hypothetical protein A2631_02100 [Candidatus Daviesbacteria bacterium RIFCSPHIGHO2_01_FULL_44_29]OGE39535.1 MAG: hypothetical protein A3E86_01800 [Candidatus Daviesbacteria bacterium RIFCSPHIGHO2_12_FULL_47_45]OGE41189.1 MAG: hypothetical protein A3D25_01495 [Candidatus Daviesbacteria bacterium RIFCSPHIGHO2_02_FULL_43_12]OGE69388.1 MAG: hypothetical protein A3B55_03235 [Candidatus Daviesbacteria bacterium RIFCSPLOWO2_01_FULL_43_15]